MATSPTLTERLTEVLCRLVNGPAESCQVSTLSTHILRKPKRALPSWSDVGFALACRRPIAESSRLFPDLCVARVFAE